MKTSTLPMPAALLIVMLLSGCVAQTQYQQAVDERDRYQREVAKIDSLQRANNELQLEVDEITGFYKNSLQQLEQYVVTNKSLFTSFQDLQAKYDRIIEQREAFNTSSTYEKQNLTEQLSAYRQELDKKEQYLRNLEWELAQKEERLNRLQQQGGSGGTAGTDPNLQALRARLQQKEAALLQMRNNISQAMYGLSPADYTLAERQHQILLTLGKDLLFPRGGAQLDSRGQAALRQLANVLRNNPELRFTVTGHTDTDGTAQESWLLSNQRAIAVVQELINNGLDPYRLTAAGKAFYDPVATNTTPEGKALNQRIDILISANLEELLDLLRSN